MISQPLSYKDYTRIFNELGKLREDIQYLKQVQQQLQILQRKYKDLLQKYNKALTHKQQYFTLNQYERTNQLSQFSISKTKKYSANERNRQIQHYKDFQIQNLHAALKSMYKIRQQSRKKRSQHNNLKIQTKDLMQTLENNLRMINTILNDQNVQQSNKKLKRLVLSSLQTISNIQQNSQQVQVVQFRDISKEEVNLLSCIKERILEYSIL